MVVPPNAAGNVVKPKLLLYLANGQDRHRFAVGPALAAAAQRAGWAFDIYYDCHRSGRHFGGPDPTGVSDSLATGSLVAGGRHLDLALWLTTSYQVAAVGDPASPIWPVIKAGGEVIVQSADPAEIFSAVLSRLGIPIPAEVMVLDAGAQSALKIVTAPFLYPRILLDNCLGVDVTCDAGLRGRLESLGVRRFVGHYVDPDRARAFPGGLDAAEGEVGNETYATLTSRLARHHATWGRGTLLGDPDLIAAQLPLATRRRLIPLYGHPQTAVIEQAADTIRSGADPVYGRQYDDHDFFELGRLGRGLQIVDPDPPFASAAFAPATLLSATTPRSGHEPDDDTLKAWAEDGRVLTTLVLWAGMVREMHCIPRLIDLIAATGLRCGLVITTDTMKHAKEFNLSLLTVPEERGGVAGRVELLLGSTGRGVCAEAYMPDGKLSQMLIDARRELAEYLPISLIPRGWWPLVDARLVDAQVPRISWEGWRPIVRIPPRSWPKEHLPAKEPRSNRRDVRSILANTLRRYRLDRSFRVSRPYDHTRPGPLDPAVTEAVRSAGFEYMWTKTGFGNPASALVVNDFVALPFTAGNWDGWSPFYTVGSAAQVRTAERRLLRTGRPGWLASNIDSILWTLPSEILEKGAELFQVAQLVANGGHSGRLINVTPNVIARYARVLAARAGDKESRRSV
jgi:hypothetical protein